MPIKVACACGKKLAVKEEFAGKKGKCPACGKLLSIPRPKVQEESSDEWEQGSRFWRGEASSNDWEQRSRFWRGKASSPGSANKKSRKMFAGSVGSHLPVIIGVVIAVAALVSGGIAFASMTPTLPELKVLGGATVAMTYMVGYDQYCRYRIRYDVEVNGGTVQRISWQPFQGAFFTRGGTRGKHAKFYEVDYTDREGRTQQSLVCCHWFGTDWHV
jgi:hypothetical protein